MAKTGNQLMIPTRGSLKKKHGAEIRCSAKGKTLASILFRVFSPSPFTYSAHLSRQGPVTLPIAHSKRGPSSPVPDHHPPGEAFTMSPGHHPSSQHTATRWSPHSERGFV